MSEALVIKVVYDHTEKITKELRQSVRAATHLTAEDAKAEMVSLMQMPKTGRTYRRGRIGKRMSKTYRSAGLRSYTTAKGTQMAIVGYKFHRASAPGEAPAIDLGHLSNSLRVKYTGSMESAVYTNAEYAAALEFGRPERGLRARPYMRPAVKALQALFFRRISEALHG